ncbi:hypothetical protein V6N13_138036 [Hibiscus sabdariffa]
MSLHNMFLYGINLSGSLPHSICKLLRLQNLDLSKNSLSGSLPENFKNCKQLQRLILTQIPARVLHGLKILAKPRKKGAYPRSNLINLDR